MEPTAYNTLSGSINWNDNNNENATRPSSVQVSLLKDGEVIDSRNVTDVTDWQYSFEHFPVENGYEHIYIPIQYVVIVSVVIIQVYKV